MEFVVQITTVVDHRQYTVSVNIDLKKAFDTEENLFFI